MQPASKWKKYTVLIGVLFLLPIGFSLMLANHSTKHHFARLPYFGKYSVANGDTTWQPLPAFTLVDQNGLPFGTDSLRGRIWVASFFSLGNPNLAKITKRLLYVDFRYRDEPSIIQVHFTPDPAHDTPEKLHDYLTDSSARGVFAGRRYFLTGDSTAMDSLLRGGFALDDPANDATFWIVDREGRLRGHFNANTENEVGDCIDAVANLKKEYDTAENHEN